jgi:hypothetical protein
MLAALQFGDSAFPAGGFAFSWGLEGLLADGLLEDADDVAEGSTNKPDRSNPARAFLESSAPCS